MTRQRQHELGAPRILVAEHRQRAALQLDQIFREREADAAAANPRGAGRPFEPTEQLRDELGIDADACVADANRDLAVGRAHRRGDAPTGRGELHRVRRQLPTTVSSAAFIE